MKGSVLVVLLVVVMVVVIVVVLDVELATSLQSYDLQGSIRVQPSLSALRLNPS